MNSAACGAARITRPATVKAEPLTTAGFITRRWVLSVIEPLLLVEIGDCSPDGTHRALSPATDAGTLAPAKEQEAR